MEDFFPKMWCVRDSGWGFDLHVTPPPYPVSSAVQISAIFIDKPSDVD